jgi:hypothetical protein
MLAGLHGRDDRSWREWRLGNVLSEVQLARAESGCLKCVSPAWQTPEGSDRFVARAGPFEVGGGWSPAGLAACWGAGAGGPLSPSRLRLPIAPWRGSQRRGRGHGGDTASAGPPGGACGISPAGRRPSGSRSSLGSGGVRVRAWRSAVAQQLRRPGAAAGSASIGRPRPGCPPARALTACRHTPNILRMEVCHD